MSLGGDWLAASEASSLLRVSPRAGSGRWAGALASGRAGGWLLALSSCSSGACSSCFVLLDLSVFLDLSVLLALSVFLALSVLLAGFELLSGFTFHQVAIRFADRMVDHYLTLVVRSLVGLLANCLTMVMAWVDRRSIGSAPTVGTRPGGHRPWLGICFLSLCLSLSLCLCWLRFWFCRLPFEKPSLAFCGLSWAFSSPSSPQPNFEAFKLRAI